MNRRAFLKGLAGAVGAAIILPPTIADAAEEGRRIWALGGIPQRELPNLRAEHDALIERMERESGMTIRAAWAEMGFRVGDMVAITDFHPATGIVLPRQATNYYIDRLTSQQVTLLERPRQRAVRPMVDLAKLRELTA
jgi:hypothetical protein